MREGAVDMNYVYEIPHKDSKTRMPVCVLHSEYNNLIFFFFLLF